MEDLAELKTLARIDTLVTVVDASTLLTDLEGVQLLKVRSLGSVEAVAAVGVVGAVEALPYLLQDAMAAYGQASDEECIDDRLVAGVLVDLVRPDQPGDAGVAARRCPLHLLHKALSRAADPVTMSIPSRAEWSCALHL